MSRLADYGVIVMSRLAHRPDDVMTADEVARASRLPAPTVRKLLKLLSRGGLLSSQRGTKGGYRLARAPADISLSDVICAVEGPIALTDCLGHGLHPCEHTAHCPTHPRWSRVNAVIDQALRRVPLSEMI